MVAKLPSLSAGRHYSQRRRQPHPGSKLAAVFAATLWSLLLAAAEPSRAERRAVVIFDLDQGSVLLARDANRRSSPTKRMTALLVIDAIVANTLSLETEQTLSARAAAQAPVRAGYHVGQWATIEELLMAMILVSANDAVVALAEAVEDSEAAFARGMHTRAAGLGLRNTVFRNASGLPHADQPTTPRDMAVLVPALSQLPRNLFGLFSRTQAIINGRETATHNRFMQTSRNALGLKTGFTCRGRLQFRGPTERDSSRHAGFLLGASNSHKRYQIMADALSRVANSSSEPPGDLERLGYLSNQGESIAPSSRFIADACLYPRRQMSLHVVDDWSRKVELECAVELARTFIKRHRNSLGGSLPLLIPRRAMDVIYRIAVTGLSHERVPTTCLSLRQRNIRCAIRSPETAELHVARALRQIEYLAEENRRQE